MAEHESKRRAFDQPVERTKFIAFGCAQHEPVGAAKFIAFGVADAAAFGAAHGVAVAVPDAGTDVPAKHFAKFDPKFLAVELSDDEPNRVAKLAAVDAADHEPERVPVVESHLGPDEPSDGGCCV